MGIKIISSLAEATARGIYGQFQREIGAVKQVGTGRVVMLCQLPWGPVGLDSDGSIPSFVSPKAFRDKFAPGGFTRTGAAYALATQFPWADLKVIRVLAADAVKATTNLQKTGPANCVGVTVKYFGAEGNGITYVVAAASDGVANHFNLTVTKTNSSTGKNTVEKYTNVDSDQAAGTYWTNLKPDGGADSVLTGGFVKTDAGRPVNGTYTTTAGSNGSAIVASDYIGTPSSPDKGVSLCETDPDVSFIFATDVSSGILATVNAGLAAHQALMNDRRQPILGGLSNETATTAKTNSALNQGDQVFYVNGFGKLVDEDSTGDTYPMIEVPLTGVVAGLAAILQPHVSVAIKDKQFTKFCKPIKGLTVGPFPESTLADLEKNGVIAFQKNSDGVFSPYCDVATDKVTPMFVSRMRRFIMFSIGNALEDYRNTVNADPIQEEERSLASNFLRDLVQNGKGDDVLFKPAVKAAALLPEEAANTTASEDAGDYAVPYEVKLFSDQKRIILRGLIGTTVTLSVASL